MSAVTETELAAKAVSPRVTPADIDANILSEHYFTAADGVVGADFPTMGTANRRDLEAGAPAALGLLTFCVLVLTNGFTVTGESACASPENFDAEIGKRIARENAVQKVWPLMGYGLKERLYQRTQPAHAPEAAVESYRARVDGESARVGAWLGMPQPTTSAE